MVTQPRQWQWQGQLVTGQPPLPGAPASPQASSLQLPPPRLVMPLPDRRPKRGEAQEASSAPLNSPGRPTPAPQPTSLFWFPVKYHSRGGVAGTRTFEILELPPFPYLPINLYYILLLYFRLNYNLGAKCPLFEDGILHQFFGIVMVVVYLILVGDV